MGSELSNSTEPILNVCIWDSWISAVVEGPTTAATVRRKGYFLRSSKKARPRPATPAPA
jgi:hypothetical protein